MSITILSPYLLFFVDEANKMWTLLKDGRIRFIKECHSFQSLTSDNNSICGVSFNGEKTDVIQTDFTFNPPEDAPLLSEWGYFYYPTLLNIKKQKIAIIKADLLNPSGTGDLIIFEKARTKFHPKMKLAGKIAPARWNPMTGELYYITAKNALARTNGEKGEIISTQATHFALNPFGTELVYFGNDCISILSLQTGRCTNTIAFDVTALSFGISGNEIYFATEKQGRCGIYKLDKKTGEVVLVINHSCPVRLMTHP